ncbi:MAG: TonB-dependent receptor [Flavobacteriaceae bacterium CG_4_8_14_3_um_filter_34_10]|nr:TonB-dependent receptor plug domain-containing protein [Flavobacteriia bacterium]PIQ19585.1 MAG: TonB-dependent receptor [Flavobacteriaceae bacterium CG18_big_fil_WC_8_21_14_2_50_34_36]PIV50009.1 MAG: TonB-dependent receptor [Flavobacteriaceae bacterium CG02_land_8_20_14_3_00_34_13]PIX10206.1 MAG: TonB-dependent receptor [Flavobacteriaceae bacterium CG_4_8_14_3_um_filter_34_10]PIZ07598.1 MAG: TonB-dependent receptor [Flavobacteriaceae bacterium CG_4_10_14_0_8_um_filter_34_31]PJC08255.1 MAG:
MKTHILVRIFFIAFLGSNLLAQTATIKGIILDDQNQPIPGVNITYGDKGVLSDFSGFYLFEVPAEQEITIVFSHISFKKVSLKLNLKRNEDFEFNPVMLLGIEQIGEIVISGRENKKVQGITSLTPETIRRIPGANAGVENLLKALPGVSSNNELSTQYSVRGGNYDENLVYVNEIEVYRPFLIRSGQQEGLSFVNSDLTSSVDFSAGGFQAKYGDKLSSVLDITYRRPASFDASADLSLLGASVAAGGISKNGRLTAIAGLRYRDNSLLVDAQETETNFKPVFADVQTYLTYKVNNKLEIGFLGNLAINKYSYKPLTRQTNFGTLTDPIALLIFYEGQEEDRYDTYFGALKSTYVVNENLTLKWIASAYHTQEQEYFDILAQYRIGEVNTDIGSSGLGDVEFSRAIGGQLTHARNDLDALIFNIEHKGDYNKNGNLVQYGLKYTREDIRDRIQEFEIIDSAGFSIRPIGSEFINDQPYSPFTSPLVPFNNIRAFNDVQIDRLSGFLQWSKRYTMGENEVWLNAGVRAHNWTVSGEGITSETQTVFSPRAQIAIKPNWQKDMLFKLSGGLYHQPPFYRELRDETGTVIPDVKAQQSFHIVLGNDYSFKMWNRPFVLNSEMYYKSLTDVNTYTLENVRIRYRANNNAEAYAYGLDLRLTGEFVPGTESWLSFGYLKTEENLDNRGYISRPTDQRLKFAILFQDYMPRIPGVKVYINLVYNTGLPGGSPSFADPYDFQTRLPDYKRADVGFSYVLVDESKLKNSGWLKPFKEFTLGFEIFNIFDVQNSITNTFVRDVSTKVQYSVPNFLTPRVFNVRTTMRF